VALLYPRALGSLFVASYDLQGLRWSCRKLNFNPRLRIVVASVTNCVMESRYVEMREELYKLAI
jgi:hypothetical protein